MGDHLEIEKKIEQNLHDPEVFLNTIQSYLDHPIINQLELFSLQSDRIDQLLNHWEKQESSVQGIKILIQAATFYGKSNFEEAEEKSLQAIKALSDSPFQRLNATALVLLGIAIRTKGDLDKSMQYLLKGLENEHHLTHTMQGAANFCLGDFNLRVKDFEKAEYHYLRCLEACKSTQHPGAYFRGHIGISELYLAQKKMSLYKKHVDAALAIPELGEIDRSRGIHDLGVYHFEKGNSDQAISYFQEALCIREKLNRQDAASTSMLHIAKALMQKDDFKSAQKKLEAGLEICLKHDSKSKLLECYKLLADTYEKQFLFEKANQNLRLYILLQTEINQAQIENVFKIKNDLINKQRNLIEDSHREILDSINYAKRIQTAILPPQKLVEKKLPNSFIFYLPKDIVAGDFYWMEPAKNGVLFAVADCTGHGVPGAMVSVVCNGALNRSVREFGLTTPGQILDKTRELVIKEFEKSEEEVKDGMDIALCKLDGTTLLYAGANNPLWIVRNGEIIETKADKQPIGKFEQHKPFTTHTFELEKGDSIYIFSDGYPDQFGGERGKKYKSGNFKKFLISIQENSIEEQYNLIDQEFENWKGEQEQIDDVCVIGVKI